MMRPFSILLLAMSPLGCSSDEANTTPCSPGEVMGCTCSDGSQGQTSCRPDGKSVGACTGCGLDGGAEDTGAGGSTGGMAGWPATGGTGGGAGGVTGGAAGSAPMGGGAGEGGSAGAALGGTGGGTGGYTPDPGGPAHPPAAVFPNDPAPDGYSIVQQVAAEHPDWLLHSCVEEGGSNDFIFEVARRLRAQDTRWGLNWKRGVVNDLSQDVVDYHYGADPSEGSTNVYIIDIIVGHCGPDPQPGWLDQTEATLQAGTVGMWTLAGQDLGP